MDEPKRLDDPAFEPTDEDLIGLSKRAFAHVPRAREESLRKMRQEIAAGSFNPNNGKGSFSKEFARKVGAKGWIGMTWPKQYGGHERSHLERYVVIEEMLAHRAPTRSYSTAQSQGYYAAIITDLSGGSVQATSSTVGVTWFRWGVDSCDRVTDDYNAVVSALGKPEFWGRYIGSTSFACNVTAADASFAHSNGVAILPVYAEDGSAAFTSQAAGQQAATWAVDAAHNLGIPGGTVIMLDAEPSYGVVAGSLQGWADSIAVSGYKPGFYEYSGNPFASAFCTAASDPNVANALLWTTQPNVQPHGHRALSAAPAFGPSPTCGYGASALQYFTQDPNNVIPPNVDDDEALASIPLW